MFRYIILGLLRGGAAYHGYALMKHYKRRSGVNVNHGNFYRELQRLVANGLVQAAANPRNADPRRTPYGITQNGAIAFDEWLIKAERWMPALHDDELSTRALFVGTADKGIVSQVLDHLQGELWFQAKMLECDRRRALQVASEEPGQFCPLPFLISRRIKRLAADLEFLDEFRAAYVEWSAEQQKTLPIQPQRAPTAKLGTVQRR